MSPTNQKSDDSHEPEQVIAEIAIIESLEVFKRTTSEDIQILEDRKSKYLAFQDKIKAIIRVNESKKNLVIEDIVNAVLQLGTGTPNYLKILTLGFNLILKHLKRKKLKKVIENVLEKIFDVSLDYSVDYEDLKWTCDFIGGEGYFNRVDHRAIYIAIIQKLKSGPIREECLKNGIVSFINDKLIDINNNFFKFRTNEL
jgi:hypothetical protein